MDKDKLFYDIKMLIEENVPLTFSEMCFIDATIDNNSPPEVYENYTKIDVKEPFSGCFYLGMSNELKYMIYGNIYGSDSVEDGKADDTILEILNVLCGNIMSKYSKGEKYEISLPKFLYGDFDLYKQSHFFVNFQADLKYKFTVFFSTGE